MSIKGFNPMDKLMAQLAEQQAVLDKQHDALLTDDDIFARTVSYVSSTSSLAIAPAADSFESTVPTTGAPSPVGGEVTPQQYSAASELLHLKLELQKAQGKIAQLDQELVQNRITRHTIDQVIGSTSEADFPTSMTINIDTSDRPQKHLAYGNVRPQFGRDHSWPMQDDARSDSSDALSASGFNRARALWSTSGKQPYAGPAPVDNFLQPPAACLSNTSFPGLFGQWSGRVFQQPNPEPTMTLATPMLNNLRGERYAPEHDMGMPPLNNRRQYPQANPRYTFRGNNNYPMSNSSYDGYTPASSAYTPSHYAYGSVGGMAGGMHGSIGSSMAMGMGAMQMPGGAMGYQPQPVGTPLSPHAAEFTFASSAGGWKDEVRDKSSHLTLMRVNNLQGSGTGQTYIPTTEPLNYRRLLDRTVNCDWKYIVDKIVCSNDQQASIFLQQKLKVGNSEQKLDIVEAIVAQAYPLMVNRFGNFLVQRCFEHGTPEQVIKIAEAIRGNTLNLSMDAFGCHVVQKAFDSVPEEYKAIMVHELLRRIPETVIHRYACHVWQKLFELRWTESPPQIMKYVNESLWGMWHEVALGETGSLVVQNIFENCLEDDKVSLALHFLHSRLVLIADQRPCIEEVLASIDVVAHGQFGNWCIQHICEHGAPADRSRAIDHVIRYASEYSMDQFASKVVEKCLKIGGVEFLGRYLDRVCEGRHDRPRIPLIDIASDQYGNYLIQYILTHSNPQHREIVATHIRKHMVSLRGSKFGSRVGMLCTNPAFATRPGPGVGPISVSGPVPGPIPGNLMAARGMPTNPRYGGAYR